jgi:hypothetical protein
MPKNLKIASAIEHGAYNILTAWVKEIRVCYYEKPAYKRNYGLHAYHSWGSAYCDWEGAKPELVNMLRENGATNIVGTVKWNRVELYFDLKKSVDKETKQCSLF